MTCQFRISIPTLSPPQRAFLVFWRSLPASSSPQSHLVLWLFLLCSFPNFFVSARIPGSALAPSCSLVRPSPKAPPGLLTLLMHWIHPGLWHHLSPPICPTPPYPVSLVLLSPLAPPVCPRLSALSIQPWSKDIGPQCHQAPSSSESIAPSQLIAPLTPPWYFSQSSLDSALISHPLGSATLGFASSLHHLSTSLFLASSSASVF